MASFPTGAEHHHMSTLTVLEGVHQGVSLPLDMAACSIGAGQQSDLVLGDPGVAERHVTLRLSARHVAVEALGGDVRVFGQGRETRVAQGSGYRARLPFELIVGQARLRLDAPASGGATVAPASGGTLQWMMAVVFMFICAGALAVLRDDASPVSAGIAMAPVAAEAKTLRPSLDTLRAELEHDARAAGLEGLRIGVQNGQLRVRGSLTAEQQSRWADMQRAFDGRHGRYAPLHSEVALREPGAQPRVRFQAVWFGDNPYVINAAGARLYPGAALEHGWTLLRIDAEQVVLARGEERFAFTLGAPASDEG